MSLHHRLAKIRNAQTFASPRFLLETNPWIRRNRVLNLVTLDYFMVNGHHGLVRSLAVLHNLWHQQLR